MPDFVDTRRQGWAGSAVKSPATLWVLLGAFFVGLQVYLYGRWLLSGPIPTPPGDTPIPSWMNIAVWVHIGLGIPIAIAMGYLIVVKPWRAQRQLTFEALFALAILSLFWQDLLTNFLHYRVVYTTAWPNLGSWSAFIPGWQSPNGNRLASAAIFFFPMYLVVLYGFTSLMMPVMRAVLRRRSHASNVEMFGYVFALALVANLTLEAGWARLGLYVFPSTIHWLTLFAGHYYQYPVYHAVIWAASWAGLCCLRFYRNDAGLSFAERGIDKLPVAGPRRTFIRFLALAGAANVIFLGYNLLTGIIDTQAGPWIPEISTKTYYTNGLCQPETAYVCPPGVHP